MGGEHHAVARQHRSRHAGEKHAKIKRHYSEAGTGREIGKQSEGLIGDKLAKGEAGTMDTLGGPSLQMLDHGLWDKMSFKPGHPRAMAEIGLFVITEEVFVEQVSANTLQQFPSEHHASALP